VPVPVRNDPDGDAVAREFSHLSVAHAYVTGSAPSGNSSCSVGIHSTVVRSPGGVQDNSDPVETSAVVVLDLDRS
jgi:hypothetical protein